MKKISVCISIACIISSILFANGQKDASGAKTKSVAIAMCIHSTDNAYWNEEAEGGKLFAASLPAGSAEVQVLTCDGDDAVKIRFCTSIRAMRRTRRLLPNCAKKPEFIGQACGTWPKVLIRQRINTTLLTQR